MEFAEKLDHPQGVAVEQLPMARVPIAALIAADSPRRSGESLEHVRRLAESEDGLPPILVHRSTMRIVDGMHRFRAAQLRGQQEIEVRYFDGDEASAFVLAVQANIMHGLPLSLADRKAAAARVMTLYPHWSDRMVALATGLAAKTVAAQRKRPDEDKQQLDVRVGRDGRARPINGAQRRQIAASLMAQNPEASLREIARQAGISPETVRDVRARQSRSQPAAASQPDGGQPNGSQPNGSQPYGGQPNGAQLNGSGPNGSGPNGHGPNGHGPNGHGPNGSREPGLVLRARANGRRPGEVISAVPATPVSSVMPEGTHALRALRGDPAFRSTESGRSMLRMLSTFPVIEELGSQILDDAPVHCLNRLAEAAQACARSWQYFADLAEQRSRTPTSKAQ
jgi:ParB-like chromosome segregation protein Spo0J